MKYELPKLKYEFAGLEPYIDAKTVETHYSKHHQTYTDKLNAGLEKHPELYEKDLTSLLQNLNEVPEDIRGIVRNHGGGYLNHNIYWATMTPGGKRNTEFEAKIAENFTSFDNFKAEFVAKATGFFGSGWVWLVKTLDNKLIIVETPNQDHPQSGKALLGIDVWEHAYYLKYQNRRAEYIEAWWNLIDWDEVNKSY